MNMKKFNLEFKKDKGQSLLEVTVLVGLALITVSGLVIVTVNGLKNSQYSQNQAQATKLAQDGMDQVKGMASRNCAVTAGSTFYWFNSRTNGDDLVWGPVFPSPATFHIVSYSTCNDLTPGLATSAHDLTPTGTDIFTRDILIEDDVDTVTGNAACSPSYSCKRVVVTVTWSDFSGDHESRLATIMTENL